MKITEKQLLAGYAGKTQGGNNISEIAGERIYWDYRTGRQEDGYNPVTSKERAGEITLEYNRVGTIELDNNCADHPAIARIEQEEAEMWGVEVR